MATGKKVILTLTAVALAAIAAVSFAFDNGAKVYAATEADAYYAENEESVAQSGVDPDGRFAECYRLVSEGFEAELNYAKMKSIVYAAEKYSEIDAAYNDAFFAADIEKKDLEAGKQAVADAKNQLKITQSDISAPYWANGAEKGYKDACDGADATVKGLADKIDALKKAALDAFVAYRDDAVKAVKDKYDELAKYTIDNPDKAENEDGKIYGKAQLTAIGEINFAYADEDGKILSVGYNAAAAEQLKEKIDGYKNQAIALMTNAPRNSFEQAYLLYMDWLGAVGGDKTASDYESKVSAAVNAAKVPCKNATADFYAKATVEIKTRYSSENKNMLDFLDGIEADPLYTPVRLSKISAKGGAVVIMAKYADGSFAEVLPENCVVSVWNSANGAAKRNATRSIKQYDNNLSAAYFIYLDVYKGSKPYEVPSVDKNGKAVHYEVQINLAQYFLSFGKYDKDRTENIAKALNYINLAGEKENLSLCYRYADGKTSALKFTDENGYVTFTTDKFGSFCIAGTGLDNIFAEPLFWLIVLVVVVLLILLSKTIFKHSKFTVKFVTNGGNKVESLRVCRGECIMLPDAPAKEGFVFAGWYSDKELATRFMDTVLQKRKSIKLYAKWAAPVTRERLDEFYDLLRAEMTSYEKVGFKPSMGIKENELVANMFEEGNAVTLYLSCDPERLRKEGFTVENAKDKRFEEVPSKKIIACETAFSEAMELVSKIFAAKGLQKKTDTSDAPISTDEERKQGFVYFVHNERVASSAEDYFELLRINLKSYVMEKDPGTFKPGDRFTLARIYITNEVACLHLPLVKKERELSKPSRNSQFEDTPVVLQILTGDDLLEAYELIAEVMEANGFVKCPENSNDLKDVQVPTTNGFAYTLKF